MVRHNVQIIVCITLRRKWGLLSWASSAQVGWHTHFLLSPQQPRIPCWEWMLYTVCVFQHQKPPFSSTRQHLDLLWGGGGGVLAFFTQLSFLLAYTTVLHCTTEPVPLVSFHNHRNNVDWSLPVHVIYLQSPVGVGNFTWNKDSKEREKGCSFKLQ